MNWGYRMGGLAGAVVDWRARRIADPVARLRFLRHTLGDQSWFTWAPEGRTRGWLRRHRLAVVWSAAALVLIPAGELGVRWSRVAERSPIVVAGAGIPGETPLSPVWLAEQQQGFELWSNGLRVERRFEVAHEPREYQAYALGREAVGGGVPRTGPAGIVFHTTESNQADFEADNARRLRYIGEALLRYVQDNRSYHYVVDRFGRVWRVVREADTANHAGYSVWADQRHTYINLNRAFLGVSIEAQSQPGEGRTIATPAQIHAMRLLTEMLRSKYSIAAMNCVTHAQVSVNPSNLRIGYHTDWAAHFPYGEIGLPDNYARPLAALWLFGFSYDPQLMETAGEAYRRGILLGEEQLRQNATAHGVSVARWRKDLHTRYRAILKELQQAGLPSEQASEHKP